MGLWAIDQDNDVEKGRDEFDDGLLLLSGRAKTIYLSTTEDLRNVQSGMVLEQTEMMVYPSGEMMTVAGLSLMFRLHRSDIG